MSNPYAGQSDLLEALSQQRQAHATNDPNRRWRLASLASGTDSTFATPYIEATTITAYVNNVETAATLSRGTGTGGVDRIVFSSPPAASAIIEMTADSNAINLEILQKALDDAAGEINRYLCGRYTVPITTPASTVALLTPICVTLAKLRLYSRNDVADRYTTLWGEVKEARRWLEKVGMGPGSLPPGTPVATATTESSTSVMARSERAAFDPTDPAGDTMNWTSYGSFQ